ncbi:hypothetical protein F5Y05DRAFT_386496 [Hypoxylon sp. FL0543]|nr:hypothetical protein F5Y05DRAFT_386496 [Hypoxylon sp. FL0543]
MEAERVNILALPAEIFVKVCSHLTPSEGRGLRLCCKELAFKGAHHCFQEIVFHLYRPDFDRLRALANHPIIGKNIKSLYYEAASIIDHGTDPYLDVVDPRNPEFDPYLDLDTYLWRSENPSFRRRVKRSKENWLPNGAFDHNPIRDQDIAENYHQYKLAVDQQMQILWNREDFALFEEIIPRLTGLKKITVNQGPPEHRSPYDCFFKAIGSHTGPKQLRSVIHGLRGTNIQLHGLCSKSLPVTLINAPLFNQIAMCCKELRSISLNIPGEDLSDWDTGENQILYRDTRRIIDTQIIPECLKGLSKLEVISVTFGVQEARHLPNRYPGSLRGLIPLGYLWRSLRQVELAFVETERHDLCNLFEMHERTMKVIRLHCCKLTSTSWLRLLHQMKRRLRLSDVCISGRVVGQFEAGEDSNGYLPANNDDDVQNWWLGNPETMTPGPSLTADLTAWFLHNAPCPLVPGIQDNAQPEDDQSEDEESADEDSAEESVDEEAGDDETGDDESEDAESGNGESGNDESGNDEPGDENP